MTRSFRLQGAAIAFVLAFAVGLPQQVRHQTSGGWTLSFSVTKAEAQEKRKRRSLLRAMFGRRDARKKRVQKRVRAQPRSTKRVKKRSSAKRKKRTNRTKRRANAAKRAAAVAAVEKAEDAKVV